MPKNAEARYGGSMTESDRYIFYGDLNCPFCYALNEQIHDLGVADRVQWRGIQHMPTLPSPWRSAQAEDVAEMTDEVNRVCERLPELPIGTPMGRPNSELATRTLIAAELIDPSKAVVLRRALYRGLWVHGQDISSPEVVSRAAAAVGLEGLTVTTEAIGIAAQWQRDWEQGGLDGRIPVVVSPRGATALGLNDSRRTLAFLKSGILSSDSGETC